MLLQKLLTFFFNKNSCELDIVLTRTVNILTTNKLVKLMTFWTTGPRSGALLAAFYMNPPPPPLYTRTHNFKWNVVFFYLACWQSLHILHICYSLLWISVLWRKKISIFHTGTMRNCVSAGLWVIGLDKSGYQVNIFLISPQKHTLWYSLEAPHRGASNEYPQHMFSWRNKKNINSFGLKKAS